MNTATRVKLFLMMVLEFFIWGAWLPLIFGYLPSLGFNSEWQQPLILNAFPIAAVVGMFFSNQFADRNFAAEKFLAFSHLVGGLAILALAFTKSFWPFFFFMLVHCLLYVPTISITNSIAFAQMKDAQKEFGVIRMGGTIGWILAAWPFTFILVDWDKVRAANPEGLINWLGTVLGSGLTGEAAQNGARWTYIVAGIASLVLSAFSLTLPHTPPKKATSASDKLAWLEAMRLLRHPFVLVLWLVTFLYAFVHNCYFNCFVDEYFPKDARASAQGLFNVMILGIGALVANSVCPYLLQKVFTADTGTNFRGLFLVPMSFALLAAFLLFAFFHPPRKEELKLAGAPAPAH